MNFDAAEELRTGINTQIDTLRNIKTKNQQQKYNMLIKNHESSINNLLEEMDSLREEFNMFKLHTLSTFEQRSEQPRRGKCVTNPFSIYIIQK